MNSILRFLIKAVHYLLHYKSWAPLLQSYTIISVTCKMDFHQVKASSIKYYYILGFQTFAAEEIIHPTVNPDFSPSNSDHADDPTTEKQVCAQKFNLLFFLIIKVKLIRSYKIANN